MRLNVDYIDLDELLAKLQNTLPDSEKLTRNEVKLFESIFCLLAEINNEGWISVKDKMPEHGGEYLVVRNSFGICRIVDVCGYDKKSRKFGKIDMDYVYDGNGWYEVDNVTHWMPLPEPPKEGEHEN